MKSFWQSIIKKVEQSPLSKFEQSNVVQKLDITLGKNLIENKFPIDNNGLQPDEYAVYKTILEGINNINEKFEKVKDENGYQNVVKQIIAKKPNKKVQSLLLMMDEYYEDNNWKGVNSILNKISREL